MQNLIRNKYFQFLFTILIFNGCATSSYKIFNQTPKGKTEIVVTPDRVVMMCEDVQNPDEKPEDEYGRYGFMMHVLTDKNNAITVIVGSVMDKESCFDLIEIFGKILRNGKRIYLGGMGDLNDAPAPHKEFPIQGLPPGFVSKS